MKKDSIWMSWTLGLIAGMSHVFAPKITRARLDHIEKAIDAAQSEGSSLADSLNRMADTNADPFKEFAHRARQSQFKKLIRESGN